MALDWAHEWMLTAASRMTQPRVPEEQSDHYRLFKYIQDLAEEIDITNLFEEADEYQITVEADKLPWDLKMCIVHSRTLEVRLVHYSTRVHKFVYRSQIYGSRPRLFSLGQLADCARSAHEPHRKKLTEICASTTEIIPPLVSIIAATL